MRLDDIRWYDWPPKRPAEGNGEWAEQNLATVRPLERTREAAVYIPHPALIDAVNLALLLGKPLLVTGEPGTGKTKLASSIAWQLGFQGPFKFVAKSDSKSRDLFYEYDALDRFQAIEAARLEGASDHDKTRPKTALNFIRYVALGRAILFANANVTRRKNTPTPISEFLFERVGGRYLETEASKDLAHPGLASRSVVVIDEIDKAPRDFANDLLDELDNLRFKVPEISSDWTPEIKEASKRPVIIITSNSERPLPEPFLRRCLYFEIPFPNRRNEKNAAGDYCIEEVVFRRLGEKFASTILAEEALDFFSLIRESTKSFKKKPATAELIDWFIALETLSVDDRTGKRTRLNAADRRTLVERTMSVLLKTPEDEALGQETFEQWLNDKSSKRNTSKRMP